MPRSLLTNVGTPTRPSLAAPRLACPGCGEIFAARISAGDRRKNCSRECRSIVQARVKAEVAALHRIGVRQRQGIKECPTCGNRAFRNRLTCSDRCKRPHRKKQQAEQFKRDKAARYVDPRPCAHCKRDFVPEHLALIYCGPSCARKVQGSHTHRARARRYGGNVQTFKPARVFERDHWTCCLCGTPTPQTLRGTCAPNAPELDHVIPLSAGGDHTPDNTQCLCRQCNSVKGALPMSVARLLVLGTIIEPEDSSQESAGVRGGKVKSARS
jgi:hypothetical protein